MRKGHSLSVLLIAFSLAVFVPSIQAGPSHTYAWHAFYGSNGPDSGSGIIRDGSGNLYITGRSYATWSGPAGQSPIHAHSGNYDIFVLKLDSNGAYQWHTFHGSNGSDSGLSIITDTSGNLYITGESNATWNGPAGESPLNPHSGLNDIVVLKLNSSGAYQWHTFHGSNASDSGSGIITDGSGNVFITGRSYATWNGSAGQSPIHAHSGNYDIFVLKLDSNGAYQWHTFHGSNGSDNGSGIVRDGSGNLYITGESNATWNGPAGESPLNPHSGLNDIVVLKLNSSGAYQWHTFHGSNGSDSGFGIITDTSGNLYITGESNATWNGPAGESPLNPHSGLNDIVVLKLNSSGAYQWHTFHGSNGLDSGSGIVVDGSGNPYITGKSTATWNGPAGESPIHAHSGNYDIFVLKLDSSGAYQWHTFHGSNGSDSGSDISTDTSGNLYITGESNATWNGPAGESPLNPHSGLNDAFVLKLAAPVPELLPDLIETAVGNPPANSMPGSSFSVTDTVKNQGSASAGASITSYYLSLNTTKGSGDILLTGSRSVPSLGINETNDGLLTVTIPSSTAVGSYFLLACSDNTNLVEESFENNNCIASASKVGVGPVVSVTATDPAATEGGDTGTFRITRTGDTTSGLSVRFAMSGSARNGSDYNTLTSPVTIPAGAAFVDIVLTPIDDSIYEGNEPAVLTLSANPAYLIGSPGSATVTIQDNDPRPSFLVISPNGGETLAAGSTQIIQWSYAGNPGSLVRIQLFKGGALNRTIASTSVGSGGSGSYNWSVSSTQVSGNDYRIKVTSATNAAYADTSDNNFTIVGPPPLTISVTSPNGGESFTAGSTQTIQWTYSGNPGPFVRIELLKGVVVTKVITTLARIGSGGSGSYNWSIPSTQMVASDYQIKVTSTSNAAYTDTSDGNFTIVAPTVTLVSPNGGETWAPGSTQTISWTYTGGPGTYLKIELLKGGILNRTITYLAVTSRGSFSWRIPATQIPGTDYSIKITSRTNPSCTDTSDLVFAIAP